MSDVMNALANPYSRSLKKFIFDVLGHRYNDKHDELLERIAHSLVTRQDVEGFSKLISDVYESAYMKCLNDHKELMQKMGHNVTVTPGEPESESAPIFK